MAPHDDDWSDSDEDELPDVETSVLLGIPDGAMVKQEDIDDAAVSRLGGYPALLPRCEPPLSSAQCENCKSQMELLVQLWCPLEESPMDRALYVWGCSRSSCQRKHGSIRAFRGLRHNDTYAAKLEKKRAKKEEARLKKETEVSAAKKTEEKRKARAKVNPFSVSTNMAASSGLFGSPSFGTPAGGIGTQLFGTAPQSHPELEPEVAEDETATSPPSSDVEDEDDEGSSSEESEVVALASTPSTTSPWRGSSIPAYAPPQYLSTDTEYIPAPPKQSGAGAFGDGSYGIDEKSGTKKVAAKTTEGAGDQEAEKWNAAMEGYENSLDVDQVFERFVRRVSYVGEQCVRYELGGTPLPYASDETFKALFPFAPADASRSASHRAYDPSNPAIAPCPRCGGRRVFECQLMPNLINVLKTSTNSTPNSKTSPQTDEERKRELERFLKGKTAAAEVDGKDAGGGEEVRGMEWGTCMVFSCEKDCCLADSTKGGKGKEEAKECWREELVLVQWEE